jgi:ABC-type nitrate/sulfonate/bicarbonate transport system ATPase subunit
MQKRPLLLLDEPFGALDAILREQMYKLLRKIQSKHSTTMLMVTHDFRDALALSDRIFLLVHGQIVQEWTVPTSIRHDHKHMWELQEELRAAMLQGTL